MKKDIEVLKREASKIIAGAEGLVIKSLEDYKLAFEQVKRIKEIKNQWQKYWEPIRINAYRTWKEIKEKENQGLEILEKAERIIKEKALAWKQEQERKAEQERLKLQAEIERRARIEKERLLRQAEKLKTPEKKEALIQQANQVVVPEVKVQSNVEKVEGVATKKIWKAKLVNMDELIQEAVNNDVAKGFLKFDEKMANAFAKATKGKVKIAGVEFYSEEIVVVKTEQGGEK